MVGIQWNVAVFSSSVPDFIYACPKEDACVVVLDDESVCRISPQKWKAIVEEGLQACGYLHDRKVVSISFNPEQCMKGMI